MEVFENGSFVSFTGNDAGIIFDDSDHKNYPIKYYHVINGEGADIAPNRSYYGFIYEGDADILRDGHLVSTISQGMYFSSVGNFEIIGQGSKIVMVEVFHELGIYPQTDFSAMFTVGGPVEQEGRLNYIDGCTDSLLIPPVKLGDPCFNHLHFPASINQTQHTHPSHRIGIVARGEGTCITPFGNLPLTKGMIFIIKQWDGESTSVGLDGETYPIGQHAFKTEDSTMDVIAFHPDSDFGATDVKHPMINRTIIDGISASELSDIQTK